EIADGNAIMRNAARVVGGAVDRVDEPHPIAAPPALLFADDRVVRIPRDDRLANETLDLAIHRGEDVVAALHRCRRLAERRMCEAARVTGKLAAEFESVHRGPKSGTVVYKLRPFPVCNRLLAARDYRASENFSRWFDI